MILLAVVSFVTGYAGAAQINAIYEEPEVRLLRGKKILKKFGLVPEGINLDDFQINK